MKISEVILLAVLAVFSLVLLLNSLGMPYGTEQTFGPGFLPLNLSVALLAVIGFSVATTLVGARKRAGDRQPSAGSREKTTAAARAGLLVAAIAVVVATTAAMEFVGVLPAVAVMMAVISWRFSGHSAAKSVAVSLGSVAAIYLVFEVWLNIPLTG